MKHQTRYKDCNGQYIWLGDVIEVEEHPNGYAPGSIGFEGIVTEEKGIVSVCYYDIGECEAYPLSMFPVKGRRILTPKEAREYHRTAFLGAEPSPFLYRRHLRGCKPKDSKPFSSGTEYACFKFGFCERCTRHKEREDGFCAFVKDGGCPVENAMEDARFDLSKFPSKEIVEVWEDEKIKQFHYCKKYLPEAET